MWRFAAGGEFFGGAFQPAAHPGSGVRACCLSRYYFAHTMKQVTGMSFVEYLTVFRLEKACRMFCQPRPNMLQIALSCGFHDQKDFCRAFKRRYAMTPTQYRKKPFRAGFYRRVRKPRL